LGSGALHRAVHLHHRAAGVRDEARSRTGVSLRVVRGARSVIARAACIALGASLAFAAASQAQGAAAQGAGAQGAAHTSVSGQVTITNNGMSTIPAFTLGSSAALFYLFVRRGPVSLEPEYRMGLDGRPWALIIWGRYRLQHDRFTLGIS